MSVEERFSQLAKRLNKLMDDLSALTDNKAIPYLGWFWRSIDPIRPVLRISWAGELEKHWWLDEAGKWEYPRRYVEGEEAIKVLELCVKSAEYTFELLTLLKQNPPTPEEEKDV